MPPTPGRRTLVARFLTLALVASLVVTGTVLADSVTGVYRGGNLATKTIVVQTKKGFQTIKIKPDTKVHYQYAPKNLTVKALSVLPQGTVITVNHTKNVASDIAIKKAVPPTIPKSGVPKKAR
jgi:hypothetical protein